MHTIFGIRHHGPGSARSLQNALEALHPDCVLVEGPPDADAVIPLAAHAAIVPPVALLLYVPDNPRQATYYPFADFSPEWRALRYALARGIPVRFIDLPQACQLGGEADDRGAGRNFAAETRAPSHSPDAPGRTVPNAEAPPRPPADPLVWIAETSGYSDPERWWEHLVERRRDSRDLFTGILELMAAVRAEWEACGFPAYPQQAQREAYMRTAIRTALAEGWQNVAVVCGAWHSPALLDLNTGRDDEETLAGLPCTAVAATWVPWTYNRLAQRSGYGAGIESPGWYEHIWQCQAPGALVIAWLVQVAQLLRQEGLSVSPAHVIEAVRLAESLAALRDCPVPGLPELNEAALAVFCNGDDTPMRLIGENLIVGVRLGKVPTETPTVPLQRDLAAIQKRTRFHPSASPEMVDLDLRRPLLLERSRLLHRLNVLDIPWGQLQAGRSARGTFHELWRVAWQPEFSVAIIEASLWGNTVCEAATRKLQAWAQEADLPTLTHLIEAALLSDLPEAIAGLIARVQHQVAASSDVHHLMDALPPLANVLRYGSVRQADTDVVRHVVDELAARICIGLPAACAALDDDAARAMFERINAVNGAISLFDEDTYLQAWLRTLDTLAAHDPVHGLVRGRVCRLRCDRLDGGEEVATRMGLALSPGFAPSQAAAWLEGFLHGSGMALIHGTQLWQVLDAWLLSLSTEMFAGLLPLLRRTFSTFPIPERRQLGEIARQGGIALASGSAVELDIERARQVLPLLLEILGPRT
ncbi:MAG: DUF5682 family protein [Chloroflexota bacterium]